MQSKYIRLGFTQEDINQNKSHSRVFLSGMTHKNNGHAEKSLLSICSTLTTQGRDPEQKRFRMTLWNNGAFTLIELLVVILIIAILAAVAVPQYNKAVKKSQGREIYVALNTLDKALADYYLEHDNYEYRALKEDVGSIGPQWTWDSAPVSQEQLTVQIPSLKHFRLLIRMEHVPIILQQDNILTILMRGLTKIPKVIMYY